MRALVTGSTGFVGGAICKALIEKSFSVRALHRETSNQTLLKDLPVEHVIGDLKQPDSINRAMKDVDVVFHVAALLSPGNHPEDMFKVTVEGTRTVIDAALNNRVKRLVHTSSVAALGIPQFPSEQTSPDQAAKMDENHTWNFNPKFWPYGYSKYLAELEIQKGVSKGLEAVIVNPSIVIGPGDIYRKTSSPIVQIAQQRYPFYTTGGLNIVHINDVVTCHLNALEYGLTGERYISAGENLTLMDFMNSVALIADVSAPKLLVPGKLIRMAANPIQWLMPVIDLSVPSELFHLAGYGMYYDNNKSLKMLRINGYQSSDKAIKDAFEWFKFNGAI